MAARCLPRNLIHGTVSRNGLVFRSVYSQLHCFQLLCVDDCFFLIRRAICYAKIANFALF